MLLDTADIFLALFLWQNCLVMGWVRKPLWCVPVEEKGVQHTGTATETKLAAWHQKHWTRPSLKIRPFGIVSQGFLHPRGKEEIFFSNWSLSNQKLVNNKNLLIKKKLPYFLLIKFNQCGVLQWGGRQFQILVNNIILFLIHGVKKNMDHFNSI